MNELIDQISAVTRSYKRLEKNRNRTDYGLQGHDMGINELNLALGGFIPTKVTVIGARSGIGKTSLLTPMIRASGRILQGRRSEFLFLSWEVMADFFVDRLISEDAGITVKMLHQGAKLMDDTMYQKVIEAYGRAKKIPVKYHQNSTNIATIKKIYYQFCKDCEAKSKLEGVEIIPVCAIDYLQMALFEGAKNYGIGDFMNGCKKLANETGGCFVVLAQLNRGEADKNLPQRGDLKDSADIEMACDNLVLLHRPEYNQIEEFPDGSPTEDRMMLRVVKARDGETGDYLVNCQVRNNRFWSENQNWGYNYWKDYEKQEFWYNYFKLNQASQPNLIRIAA